MMTSETIVLLYWRRVRRLTLALLLLWFAITFGVIFFARELAGVVVLGWPVPFYMASQGAMLIYLLIIGTYALAMKKIDAQAQRQSQAQANHEA
jgi:putative solute:sodium symporter small subunit